MNDAMVTRSTNPAFPHCKWQNGTGLGTMVTFGHCFLWPLLNSWSLTWD